MRKLFAILALGFFGFAQTQATPEFQFHFSDLPGPYAVGIKVNEQFDLSRPLPIPSTPSQSGPQKKSARPLQTFVWYPARKSKNPKVSLGEYESLLKTSFGKEGQGKRWKSIESYIRGITTFHTWAIRDAGAQVGHFPVVIYAPSLNAPAIENIELCEYLASQGFIVLATSSVGVGTDSMTIDLEGADAQAKDISYLIDFEKALPNTDSSRTAAIGYSWGSNGRIICSES